MDFKARPLNKKIFEKQSSLPLVEKKKSTFFDEFKLSQANTKLGKRTLDEYLGEQEKMRTAEFKALKLDKKILLGNSEVKPKERKSEVRLKIEPFNLATERRVKERTATLSPQSEKSTFKARPVPSYRFFEVEKQVSRKLEFAEFELSTSKRMSEKKQKNLVSTSPERFKARQMPDFCSVSRVTAGI